MRNNLEETVIMPGLKEELQKQLKPKKKKNKLLIVFLSMMIGGCSFVLFLFYGPISLFRDFWITSAMTTLTHKYLATWFYNDYVIESMVELWYMPKY